MTMNDLLLLVNTIKVQLLTPPFGEKFKCLFFYIKIVKIIITVLLIDNSMKVVSALISS